MGILECLIILISEAFMDPFSVTLIHGVLFPCVISLTVNSHSPWKTILAIL